MSYWFQPHVYTLSTGADTALDSTGDILYFAPGMPVDVVRWGFVVAVALDSATLTIAGDVVDITGTRNAAAGGSITLTASDDTAIGSGWYTEYVNAGSLGPLRLDAGEALALEITSAATAGDGVPFIHYVPGAFAGDSNRTGGTDANRISTMTAIAA